MKRPKEYNTRQSADILSYVISCQNEFITAGQISEHLKNLGKNIGLTTIYRHLDKLESAGKVRRYVIDGVSCASYQYVGGSGEKDHLRLKCESCGGLFNVECDFADELERHFAADHRFIVNTDKIVLYGKCERCSVCA